MELKPVSPETLKRFRERYDLKQAQAAALCGVSTLSWGRWERGTSPTPRNFILVLSAVADKLKRQETILQGY
jgi:transcriptional regulator with XRE-family HTH domain